MRTLKSIAPILLTTLAAFSSEPCLAQDVSIYEASPEAGEIIVTTSSQKSARPFFLEVGIAPTFSRDALAPRGDRLSDLKTTSSLMLGYERKLSTSLNLVIRSGIKWDSDFESGDDEADESAYVFSAKLNLDRGFRRFSPFLSYQLDVAREDFLGRYAYTDHSISAGFDIVVYCQREDEGIGKCTSNWPGKVKISPSLDRIESTKEERERTTPRLKGSYELDFYKGMKAQLVGDYQWRRFDKTSISGPKEQHRFIGEASVNFAALFSKPWVNTVSLGIRYSLADAQDDLPGVSKAEFLPALKLKFGL